MSIRKTIGGDRLGSGKKMQVDLRTYNRSSHDLGYVWKSSMAAGTLVPFLNKVMLPGDTFDIDLAVQTLTHPTIGPLFGSFKIQLDVFTIPMRLYLSELHNNRLGIGMEMSKIKFPKMQLQRVQNASVANNPEKNEVSVNPSCLLAYLGTRGTTTRTTAGIKNKKINALSHLAYWDIYKNYYANKQEEVGRLIDIVPNTVEPTSVELDAVYLTKSGTANLPLTLDSILQVVFPNPAQANDINGTILVLQGGSGTITRYASEVFIDKQVIEQEIRYTGVRPAYAGYYTVNHYGYLQPTNTPQNIPQVAEFDLKNIDEMRDKLLQKPAFTEYLITTSTGASQYPYNAVLRGMSDTDPLKWASRQPQQGLGLKTYQNDLFNNWLNAEWVDNVSTGINAITSVDTSSGSFTMDQLALSKKVYDMLNRIAISGGSYRDWLETVYTHNWVNSVESPVYEGGLSQELFFEEVISSAETITDTEKPLGTLGGKGKLSNNRKGGKLIVKVDEPSILMGIVSITPRVDYSQGNDWTIELDTIDDLHKPALDGIGFQDILQRQQAWWAETEDASKVNTPATGKQPAWINYMTSVNQTYGNFAIPSNEMFMTLNRRYEHTQQSNVSFIKDNTTYIDPSKYNYVFAQTDISAQNFWMVIGLDITARRKMSAKIMPNL